MAVGRYAQVHEASGFIANVIMWDPVANPDIQPPAGYVFVEDVDGTAGPGGSWDGTTFQPPPQPTSSKEADA
jgi:hypothetical protein